MTNGRTCLTRDIRHHSRRGSNASAAVACRPKQRHLSPVNGTVTRLGKTCRIASGATLYQQSDINSQRRGESQRELSCVSTVKFTDSEANDLSLGRLRTGLGKSHKAESSRCILSALRSHFDLFSTSIPPSFLHYYSMQLEPGKIVPRPKSGLVVIAHHPLGDGQGINTSGLITSDRGQPFTDQ